MQLPDMFTNIPSAPNYAMSEDGHVYNLKTNRRLKRQWCGGRWRTRILHPESGKPIYIRHDRFLHESPTAQRDALARESYRLIPDFPNYGVTPYGAIWCVNPIRSAPYIVAEQLRGTRRYVKLTNKHGKRCNIPVAGIMAKVWKES
jgi:hypothetical protein